MAQVTAPVILDSTGQQIVTALQNLNNNVKPTADEIKRTNSNNQTVEAALVSLNSQIDSVAITNQYSTVLAAINAYRTTKKIPFAIQKYGNTAITDLPSGVPNACEWNLICYGTSVRLVAVLTIFTGGSSKNGWSYTANIYDGEYVRGWFSPSEQIAGYGSSKIYTVGANQSITIPMTGFGVWLIFRSYAPNIVFVKANGDVESAVGNATHISVSVSNNILTVTNLLTWANMIIAMGA